MGQIEGKVTDFCEVTYKGLRIDVTTMSIEKTNGDGTLQVLINDIAMSMYEDDYSMLYDDMLK